jgi:tetratricopeptide (TPR) repeat protein
MNYPKSLLTFVIVLMASFAMAQTASQQQFYDRYEKITESEEPDTAAIHVLIEDWEKVASDDPDLIRTKIIYELMQSDPSVPGEINQPFAERIKLLAEEAITRYPNRLDLRSYNAIGYFLVGQNEKALDCLLQIIDHSQTVNGNWLGKQNKPYEKGFEQFEENMCTMIPHFFQSEDYTRALTFLDKLVAAYPQSFAFRMNHASTLANLGKHEQAIEDFLALEKEQPNEDHTIITLAQLYAETGNETKAREYCDKAIALNDFYTQTAEYIMGSFETLTVDFDEIKEYMKSHEDEYRKIEMKFKGGEAGMSLRDLSILYFGHALTPECTSTKLWDINADSLARNGKFEELLSACEETLKKHPASIAANFYAGISADNLGNPIAGLYFLKCQQLARMITKSADSLSNLGGKDDSEKAEDKYDGTKYYKILWRADENVFVDYLLDKEEKGKTLFFSEPVYFIAKE